VGRACNPNTTVPNSDPALAQAQLRARIQDPAVLEKTLIIGMRYHQVFDQLQGLLCPLTVTHHGAIPKRKAKGGLPKHLAVFLQIASEYFDTVGASNPPEAEITLAMVEERLLRFVNSTDLSDLACPRKIAKDEVLAWFEQIRFDWDGVANETADNLSAALHSEPVKAYLDKLREQQLANYLASSYLGRTREQIQAELDRIYDTVGEQQTIEIIESITRPVIKAAEDFPIHALPKVMRDMVEAVVRKSGAPMNLIAPMPLAVTSCSIGRGLVGVDLKGDGYLTFPNTYFIIAAPSGAAKSNFRLFARPLEQIEDEMMGQWNKGSVAEFVGKEG
jgi:hypothetical protein